MSFVEFILELLFCIIHPLFSFHNANHISKILKKGGNTMKLTCVFYSFLVVPYPPGYQRGAGEIGV